MEKVIGKPILKIQLIGQFYENLIPLPYPLRNELLIPFFRIPAVDQI